MASDVEGYHRAAFDVKDRPQDAFDHHGMNGLAHDGGKPVDFVSPQAGVKRVMPEDRPCFPCGFLLLARGRVEGFPESFGCRVAVFHALRGGG